MAVEFEIPSDTLIQITGDVRISVPSWMNILSLEDLKEVQKAPAHRKKALIIASGYSSSTQDIVAITAAGSFFELNARNAELPQNNCVPCDCGQTLRFPDVPGKVSETYEIDGEWYLTRARRLCVNIPLFDA